MGNSRPHQLQEVLGQHEPHEIWSPETGGEGQGKERCLPSLRNCVMSPESTVEGEKRLLEVVL